jgi:peptidoglycan/LPS O-acetylase OafA/YrhL
MVEFFFVLSGFVMYYTYGKTKFTSQKSKDFLISRTFRLYPMHFLMLLFFIGLELFKLFLYLKGNAFDKAPFTDQQAPINILYNLLLIHAWIPGSSAESYNLASWSISIEFYLYILFMLSNNRKLIFGLIVLLAAAALMSHSSIITISAQRGLYCFFIGCLVVPVYERFEKNTLSKTSFTILECLSVVIAISLILSALENKYVYVGLIFAFVILIFSFEKGAISNFLKTQPFLFLGKLSYSIYITHLSIMAVITYAFIFAGKFLHTDFTTMAGDGPEKIRYLTTHNVYLDNIVTVLILGVVVAVSYFTYNYIELKFIELGKKYKVRLQKLHTTSPELRSNLSSMVSRVTDRVK